MSAAQQSRTSQSTRRTQSSEQAAGTREEILEAAQEFLWTRPFREMTIRSLMAETTVSRPAFYQYFEDVHELMETLLGTLGDEIIGVAEPWLVGTGDPVSLLHESLDGLVRVCYRRGPILRASSDAATSDSRMEVAWTGFLQGFDDVVASRIEADQAEGLIPSFDAQPMAFALNRLDAYTFIDAFGTRPRRRPGPVRDAIARLWISALYSQRWLDARASDLIRP
jgi:AcrR family transcriptional regulator